MIDKINAPLRALAGRLNKNLYLVGGCVRNYLIDGKLSGDFDLASANTESELLAAFGGDFAPVAVYPRTGTVMFKDRAGTHYEHTAFRGEEYEKGGGHTPARTYFTEDIAADAVRRDFKCNAVYYDLKNAVYADPLGGVADIKNKTLDTVAPPEKVFCSDGLRLLRLCRFAGELGFAPTREVVAGAKKFKDNIGDIAPERIYAELTRMLAADTKYAFSDTRGHYTALKLCHESGVLGKILPELTAGDGMAQRADFHDHDVLEHSLRTVLYAHPSVRLAALLHDVGKPYAMEHFGAFKTHAEDGRRIAEEILARLKAPKAAAEEAVTLTRLHMTDLDLKMREGKVRLFIAENYRWYEKLLLVKQADYSACKDDLSVAPTVRKWREIEAEMRREGAPFALKELKISGGDLAAMGFRGKAVGETLAALFRRAVLDGRLNDREKLLSAAKKML